MSLEEDIKSAAEAIEENPELLVLSAKPKPAKKKKQRYQLVGQGQYTNG